MQVSIIIVNYNTSALLLQSIDSIYEKVQGVEYEIIVADNCSREEQKRLLRNDNRFQLIELPENLGFGQANNAAAKLAKGDCLFLLNPDTKLINDAVTILYTYMQHHQEVGICGGNLFDGEMKPTHSFHRLLPGFLYELDFATGQIYRRLRFGKNSQFNYTSKALPVAMITGADLMIRHSVWNLTNGFDPDFFMYYEDADLCKRCKDNNYGIVSVPSAHIQHLEGKSFTESKGFCERNLNGRFTYFSKHHSPLYNKLTNLMNVCSLTMASWALLCLGKTAMSKKYSQRLEVYKKICNKI